MVTNIKELQSGQYISFNSYNGNDMLGRIYIDNKLNLIYLLSNDLKGSNDSPEMYKYKYSFSIAYDQDDVNKFNIRIIDKLGNNKDIEFINNIVNNLKNHETI